MRYYVVKHEGWTAFIKPFSSVRDSRIFSDNFLTPSIITGIERNLLGVPNVEPTFIERHRLSHIGYTEIEEETVNPKNPKNNGIVNRGYLTYPKLYLAFNHQKAADIASRKAIRLTGKVGCLMLPDPIGVFELNDDEFCELDGFELIPDDGNSEDSFPIGGDTFNNNEPMYGKFVGDPVRHFDHESS